MRSVTAAITAHSLRRADTATGFRRAGRWLRRAHTRAARWRRGRRIQRSVVSTSSPALRSSDCTAVDAGGGVGHETRSSARAPRNAQTSLARLPQQARRTTAEKQHQLRLLQLKLPALLRSNTSRRAGTKRCRGSRKTVSGSRRKSSRMRSDRTESMGVARRPQESPCQLNRSQTPCDIKTSERGFSTLSQASIAAATGITVTTACAGTRLHRTANVHD